MIELGSIQLRRTDDAGGLQASDRFDVRATLLRKQLKNIARNCLPRLHRGGGRGHAQVLRLLVVSCQREQFCLPQDTLFTERLIHRGNRRDRRSGRVGVVGTERGQQRLLPGGGRALSSLRPITSKSNSLVHCGVFSPASDCAMSFWIDLSLDKRQQHASQRRLAILRQLRIGQPARRQLRDLIGPTRMSRNHFQSRSLHARVVGLQARVTSS